jgi:hypothetical protein
MKNQLAELALQLRRLFGEYVGEQLGRGAAGPLMDAQQLEGWNAVVHALESYQTRVRLPSLQGLADGDSKFLFGCLVGLINLAY